MTAATWPLRTRIGGCLWLWPLLVLLIFAVCVSCGGDGGHGWDW